MVDAYKKLDYLNLEVKSYRKLQIEQFEFPFFAKSQSEHLLHTDSSPQLNFLVDLVLLLHQNHTPRNSVVPNKAFREISDKLEYLKNSRDLTQLRKLNGITEQLFYVVKKLEERLEKLEASLSLIDAKIKNLL